MAERRRWAIPVALAAGVLLLLGLARAVPYLTAEREAVTSTPVPNPLGPPEPVTLPRGSEICLDRVPFDSRSEVARLGVIDDGAARPAVVVTARAPGYESAARVPRGPAGGMLDAALQPPRRAVIGELCVRNAGHRQFALAGTLEGRTTARPDARVDGTPLGPDVALTLLERDRSSLAGRLGVLVARAAAFRPLGEWAVWLLALLVVAGVSLAALAALGWSLRTPDSG